MKRKLIEISKNPIWQSEWRTSSSGSTYFVTGDFQITIYRSKKKDGWNICTSDKLTGNTKFSSKLFEDPERAKEYIYPKLQKIKKELRLG